MEIRRYGWHNTSLWVVIHYATLLKHCNPFCYLYNLHLGVLSPSLYIEKNCTSLKGAPPLDHP
jgi:hypothetical protein